MSKKLSKEESLKSFTGANHFRIENLGNVKKKVSVFKDEKLIFENFVTVIAGNFNIYIRLDINWEDANYNFKEAGLFGYYSTNYNMIEYKDGVLYIYDGDIKIHIN